MAEVPDSKDSHTHLHQPTRPFSNCSTNQQKKFTCSSLERNPDDRHDEILRSQSFYIDNLQQQVFLLENEVSYLQSLMEHVKKSHKNGFIEVDSLKKHMDSQKEIQDFKLDLKRKQATIDYLVSEAERILKIKEENEAMYHDQKSKFLEELVSLRKEKDDLVRKTDELENTVLKNIQRENNVLRDCDGLRTQLEELKNEMEDDKLLIQNLQESKKEAQKSLFDANFRLEIKSTMDQGQSAKILVNEIQELHDQLACTGRLADQEKLLRKQVTEDNNSFIKRIAATEAELSETKAKLREQEYICKELEELNARFVSDVAEIKSSEESYLDEVKMYKLQLVHERERNLVLATQVAEEQRLKCREQQRVINLERLITQKEETLQIRETENTQLLRDNVALKDETNTLKEQVKSSDKEVEELKQKVQKMRLSVEEFTQCTKAATRLEGQRWMQLNQLAHGIQALTKEAADKTGLQT